jgi:hypothetical protein
MKHIFRTALPALCLGLASLLGACAQPQRPYAPLPELSIGVASFSQPTNVTDLMAGYIPDDQGMAGPETLMALNAQLRSSLGATPRSCVYLDPVPATLARSGGSARPGNALQHWVRVGKQAGVDVLIVPMLIDWHEREGGEAGVTKSAAVTTDMFLIDVREAGNLLQRSYYSEKQTGLTNNLLDLGTFIKRGGKWVTGGQLVQEAIDKAIREFGL